MPAIAPSFVVVRVKIPSTRTGKKLDAARPKANATTWATKPGGEMPK